MNEQIKQAALNAANAIADDFMVGFCDHSMVEHFADHVEKHTTVLMESIIQECCTVILENGWRNPVMRIHPEEPTEIIRYVKEHFGVN
jgi:hypothetical protein